MRFGVSRVLDAIEARLTTDPLLARAVLDLAEVVRLVDLDRDTGKPATLLRLGHVIDALGRHVGEGGAAVYVVAPRGLLSDLDLTSNERMVVRRWADDGQVEVLAEPGDRVAEVAGMLAVPVISRRAPAAFAGEHPWLPGATLVPTPAGLTAPPGGARAPASPAAVWLTRLWRCPEFGLRRLRGPGRRPAAAPGSLRCAHLPAPRDATGRRRPASGGPGAGGAGGRDGAGQVRGPGGRSGRGRAFTRRRCVARAVAGRGGPALDQPQPPAARTARLRAGGDGHQHQRHRRPHPRRINAAADRSGLRHGRRRRPRAARGRGARRPRAASVARAPRWVR